MRLHSIALAVACWVGPAVGPAVAQFSSEIVAAELRSASSWHELVERDQLLTFTSGSAREAREDLLPSDGRPSPLVEPLDLSAAYFALGAGGDIRDRPLLEDGATLGPTPARIGAILGLGELKPAPTSFLLTLTGETDPTILASLCIALARTEDPRAREVLDRWIADADPRAPIAQAALDFHAGESPISLGPATEGFYVVRWRAAKVYGFVAGMRWKIYLEEELGEDEAFLDLVLLGAASGLRDAPRRDHLLEIVLAGGTPERLRGAVAGASDALAAMIHFGLWAPAGLAEWSAILDEMEARGVRQRDVPLLKAAAQVDGLSVRAGLMLVGANVKEAFSLISEELFAELPERRLAAALALGGLSDPTRAPDLNRLHRDRDARVRAAALVSLVRRRDQNSVNALIDLLQSGPSSPRTLAIEMLARTAFDPIAEAHLYDVLQLTDLSPTEEIRTAVALAEQGQSQPRGKLREMLATPGISIGLQELLIRALAKAPDREDLAAMREMFPVEDARSLNVALAIALIENRDPGAMGMLRQGIWRGPWNRSVLAAGLLARHGGIQALHDEINSPPPRATDSDLRRVGFALGEWGGLSEVDVLARRRRASDPALQGAFLGALATRTQ